MWPDTACRPTQLFAQIQADRWPEVVQFWRHPTRNLYLSTGTVVLLLGGAVALAVGTMWWVERRRTRHLRSRPLRLFDQLGAQFGLRPRDRWLLVRMARQQRLPSPLTLMLSRSTLDYHAQRYVAACAGFRRTRLAVRVRTIRETLFGVRSEI